MDGRTDQRTNAWTDYRTDQWMDWRKDKASYRVACPQLKKLQTLGLNIKYDFTLNIQISLEGMPSSTLQRF